MHKSLNGKRVLVAGASSGMGRATANLAAQSGAEVILIGRNAAALDETAANIRAVAADAKLSLVTADAADAEGLAKALADTNVDTVEIVVNSIGVNIVKRAFDELTTESWADMLDTNINAAFNLAKLFVPAMRKRGDGLIINIASIAARKPDMSGAAYQASKAAVVSLTHAIMEEEWRNGIRATAILPGMTDTPLLKKRPTPVSAEALAMALQPEDVAAACLFVMNLPARAHVSEMIIQPSRRG